MNQMSPNLLFYENDENKNFKLFLKKFVILYAKEIRLKNWRYFQIKKQIIKILRWFLKWKWITNFTIQKLKNTISTTNKIVFSDYHLYIATCDSLKTYVLVYVFWI